jgi:hypothetical protein
MTGSFTGAAWVWLGRKKIPSRKKQALSGQSDECVAVPQSAGLDQAAIILLFN